MLRTEDQVTYWPMNFVLVGPAGSHISELGQAINLLDGVVCHCDLFAADEEVRKKAHLAYFGESFSRIFPWYGKYQANLSQYIDRTVMDRPERGEEVIGCCISYADVARNRLDELFHERSLIGNFCIIHVLRNPIAAFLQQEFILEEPASVNPDVVEAYCREHESNRRRIEACCPDSMLLRDVDVRSNLTFAVKESAEFLERPIPSYTVPGSKSSWPGVSERILNLDNLKRKLSRDFLRYLDDPEEKRESHGNHSDREESPHPDVRGQEVPANRGGAGNWPGDGTDAHSETAGQVEAQDER